jgi:predicted ATPase
MRGTKFLHSIQLTNLLSYGPEGVRLELEPLNVLIGPNASGKSNLIEAISLLVAAPGNFLKPFWEGGGVKEWIWNGSDARPFARLEVELEIPAEFRYVISFMETNSRLQIVEERLENRFGPDSVPYVYYSLRGGTATIKLLHVGPEAQGKNTERSELLLSGKDLAPDQSVLSQRKDSYVYPELTYVSQMFDKIGLFRDWNFGRGSKAREFQGADLPNDFLLEDSSNLGLVLSSLGRHPAAKKKMLEYLGYFLEEAEDFGTQIEGGRVQVFLHERNVNTAVPAARLSDGTLRYLSLLAVLCHPDPPPLICIEEPELGIHPDVIPKLAELLIDAADRTQLIVTTHSESLVGALSEVPESIVVCERTKAGTDLRRLEPDKMREWLERYRLGELWSMGEIGGNRW